MSLVGKKAPEFNTVAVVGDGDFKQISLADLRGKYVVLFFYPADFTFICPTEIQEFSRRHEEFKAVNCEILGCSTDSKHSHKAWIKNGLGKLNHPLLADFNKTITRDYDALVEGEGVALRATFIIDDKGIVQHASYNADLLAGRCPRRYAWCRPCRPVNAVRSSGSLVARPWVSPARNGHPPASGTGAAREAVHGCGTDSQSMAALTAASSWSNLPGHR